MEKRKYDTERRIEEEARFDIRIMSDQINQFMFEIEGAMAAFERSEHRSVRSWLEIYELVANVRKRVEPYLSLEDEFRRVASGIADPVEWHGLRRHQQAKDAGDLLHAGECHA